jgi:type II secretory pathway pseudopilin PulG
MNKKIVVGVVIIVIVAASIATWFVHTQISDLQSQNGDLQKQIDELQDQNRALQEQLRVLEDSIEGVRILAFEWTSGWGPGAGGLRWGRAFNITLQNLGDSAVEGLSVYVKLFVNDAEVVWSETGLYGPGIIGYTAEYPHGFDGKLNASETREIRGYFVSGLDVLDEAHVWDQGGQKAFSVRVTMNGTIMDELLLPY